MIEVTNINAINKGTLLATCDVYIVPWDMELNEVKIFEKGANRWLGMPSREFVNNDGTKKYIELVNFRKEATKNRFRSQIMGAIDKYLASNPEMVPEDVIKDDEELPF